MKKDYRVVREFWRNGNLVAVGETLSLTANQAKYLSFVLEPVADAAPAEPDPAAEPAAAEEAEKPARPAKPRAPKAAEAVDGAGH